MFYQQLKVNSCRTRNTSKLSHKKFHKMTGAVSKIMWGMLKWSEIDCFGIGVGKSHCCNPFPSTLPNPTLISSLIFFHIAIDIFLYSSLSDYAFPTRHPFIYHPFLFFFTPFCNLPYPSSSIPICILHSISKPCNRAHHLFSLTLNDSQKFSDDHVSF